MANSFGGDLVIVGLHLLNSSTSTMWWIAFTAIDLYICLVIIMSIQPTLAPEKQKRARIAAKILLGGLAICGLTFLAMFLIRWI